VPSRVLDAGCGTGRLTASLRARGHYVVGVDVSNASIAIARQNFPDITFRVQAISALEANNVKRYDVVVANMLLHNTADLRGTCRALARVLKKGGQLLATLTHPCFWPRYWNYESAEWFNYNDEISIEAPFRISNNPAGVGITTHFHRPLSAYFEAFLNAGLMAEVCEEPWPSPKIERLYPQPWQFPRFLAVKLRRR
jgi:SAM-dependent methyltransferase